MVETFVAVIRVGDGTGDEVVCDLELIQTDGLAIRIHGLHPLDRIKHVGERGGVLFVAYLGVARVFRVLDDIHRVIGAHGLEEADGALFDLVARRAEGRLSLVDLLLGSGDGCVRGILCLLGSLELTVGGCLGGLGIRDGLLRVLKLGEGVGIIPLGRIERHIGGIEAGLCALHVRLSIGCRLLFLRKDRLSGIKVVLSLGRSTLRLLELRLALGLNGLRLLEILLRGGDLRLDRLILGTAGTGLRRGKVRLGFLVGRRGGCLLCVGLVLGFLGSSEGLIR